MAGPVVAAAAILPPRWSQTGLPAELAGLNDSKQLTEAQREKYFEFLTRCAEIEFGIALVDAGVIRAPPEATLAAKGAAKGKKATKKKAAKKK
jgi:ribonuclease HII